MWGASLLRPLRRSASTGSSVRPAPAKAGVSLVQALIVVAVLAVLTLVSFSSGYLAASIRYEEEKTLRAIYDHAASGASEIF